jgi:hypothetical protein
MNKRIEKLQRVVADGKHNAFPSLIRFKDALYLSYRKSAGHAMHDGTICLKRSFDNGETWEDLTTTFTDKNYYLTRKIFDIIVLLIKKHKLFYD